VVGDFLQEITMADEKKAAAAKAPRSARLITKYPNRLRNPVTNVLYSQSTPHDVIDLDAPEHAFERAQMAAGLLIECPYPAAQESKVDENDSQDESNTKQ
jgi:hypothetical protein